MGWLFPLRTRTEGARAIVVESAPSHYVKRGLLAACALPPLFALLGLVVGIGMLGGGDAGAVAFVACVGLGGVGLVSGLGVAAASGVLSRRSRVRFDAERGVVVRERDRFSVPLRDVAGVVLRPRGDLLGSQDLVVVRGDGAVLLRLHGPMTSPHAALALGIARDVDAFFGVAPAAAPAPYRAPTPGGQAISPPEPQTGGIKPNVAAGLCYLPLQGIFVIASIVALVASKDRFVRFAAKQSLAHLLFATVVGGVVVGACGAAAAVLPDSSALRVPAIVATCVLLGAFFVWHVTAYIVACVRAFRGRLWVMPWLRWLLAESALDAARD
jgi:uncharacterized membrane protein